MQTLDNKVIIYDDACPLCQAYTAGFVQAGWLKTRTGFTEASPEILANIDLDRARHEIPLVDTQTGEVVYGLNALFLILGERMPVFKPLFRSVWFKPLLRPLYQIITFNRRIIAGTGAPANGFDCAPDVNLFYRWLYILLAAGSGIWLTASLWGTADWSGKVFILSQLYLLSLLFITPKKLDFIGHWATVFLVGAMVVAWTPGPLLVKSLLALGLSAWMWWKRWGKVF